MSMAYGELHSHDEWSLLDAVGSARQGAERAAELGHPFLAKTNHAVLSGVIHHMEACREFEIMPIVAVEAYYRPDRLVGAYYGKNSLEHTDASWKYYHMVLLAKDLRGWRSLKLLTSEAFRSGWYRKPCVDDALLEKHGEGLIISTSCVSGYVPQMILKGDDAAAQAHMDKLDRWVGEDWYFELQPHDFDDLRAVNLELPRLAVARSRPIVATKDAHFPWPEWVKTQHVSVAIRTRKTFEENAEETEDDDRYDMMAPETCYIGSPQDTAELFARHHPKVEPAVVQEALRNTGEIASRCSPFLLNKSPKMPRYTASPEDSYALLRKLVFQGLKDTGHRHDPVYERQAEHELEILRAKDFSDFFLICWDFIRWARSTEPLPPLVVDGYQHGEADDPFFRYTEAGGGRDKPILVSVRGSAGGSVVSYALRLIVINPITWGLRFERFLNPNRQGLPDIDFDFAPGDVDLVKEYIKRNPKYGGADRVYDMVAHGTMAAKAAIGRVAKVFDIPFPETVAVTKLIDRDANDDDISELREKYDELDRFFDRHPEAYEHACRLQRSIGTISEHAAGVVLSKLPLDELMPVMKKAKDDDYMVTAFGEEASTQIVSSLGFLKLDLLVIVELAKIGYAMELVSKHYGVDFELDKLPIWEDPYAVDPKVMEEIFCRGALMGVFQLGGSPSISSLTKKMAPEHMFHLTAINAVHRTATMTRGIHLELVERRHDPSKVVFWDPSVREILGETYGLMIYQEQVMDIMVALGGFSPARADDVRKIMSKWYRAKGDIAEQKLGAHREDFTEHAASILSGGRPAAEVVWNSCGGFSEYSFNKSHAGVYAGISYADGFIKKYWADAFYASLLTFPPSKIKKPEERKPFYEKVVRESRLLDVQVLPPDVNESEQGFTIASDGLRFGLGSISGLGPTSIADLVEGRPYETYGDLMAWTSRKGAKCNAGGRKALGSSGALDRFGVRDDLTDDEKADGEEARLGIALSVPDRIGALRGPLGRMIHTQAEFEEANHGEVLCVGGEIIGGREISTRYGNKMAKLEIAFGADEYRLSIRPKIWESAQAMDEQTGETLIPSVKDLVATDKALIVRGTKDKAYDCISVDAVELAEDVVQADPEPAAPVIDLDAARQNHVNGAVDISAFERQAGVAVQAQERGAFA